MFDELTFGPLAAVIAILLMILALTGCGGVEVEPEMEIGCLVFIQDVDFVTTSTVSCDELFNE